MKRRTLFICRAGIIAAMYICLNLLSSALGLSYSAVQFRIPEMLTILPIFLPEAIPGLAVGCFIANLGSPLGLADLITGTIATLVSAILTRILSKFTIKNFPIFSFLPQIFINALAVGAEIAILTGVGFAISALSVALGEAVVVFAGGIPLYILTKKTRIFR